MAGISPYLSRRATTPVWTVAAALALWVEPGLAQVVDTTLWVTNGGVFAVVREGNTIDRKSVV